MTGIVRGYEIKKNRNGTKTILLLQVEISGPDDIQSVEYMSHAGDDHIPPEGTIVTILQAGRSWKIAIASSDDNNFTTGLSDGERKIFAPGGAFIIWRDDGTLEVNGDADTAVAFADLVTALNNFKTSIDTAIAGAITGHTHPGVETGTSATGPGAGAAPAVVVDISAAEVPSVKLP